MAIPRSVAAPTRAKGDRPYNGPLAPPQCAILAVSGSVFGRGAARMAAGEGAASDRGERRRQQAAERRFARELRAVLALGAAAEAVAVAPGERRLLELVVATAMRVIDARAAALLLLDEGGEYLTFEVALGGRPQAVAGERVPLGHGIAGLVAASGQPIAIGDATDDPRPAADIAARVGYQPRSLLCVPLLADDRVIGVLELLDKASGASFSPADLATLGLFAQQAGVAIAQGRARGQLARLLGDLLREEAASDQLPSDHLADRAARRAARFADNPDLRRSVELAALVAEVAGAGEAEARACAALLRGFAAYLRGRR